MNDQELDKQIAELYCMIDPEPHAFSKKVKEIIKQDQPLREIDIRIDELESICSNFDTENVLGWGIEERIAELQAQKDKLIEGVE